MPPQARRTARVRQHTSAEPDLLADVRRAIADSNPLSLLNYVSTLLCVADTRRNHPFAQPDTPDLAALTREELVKVRILSPLPAEMALGDASGGHFHAGWVHDWEH